MTEADALAIAEGLDDYLDDCQDTEPSETALLILSQISGQSLAACYSLQRG